MSKRAQRCFVSLERGAPAHRIKSTADPVVGVAVTIETTCGITFRGRPASFGVWAPDAPHQRNLAGCRECWPDDWRVTSLVLPGLETA